MKKLILVILSVVLIIGVLFSGCAKSAPAPAPAPAPTPAPAPAPAPATPQRGGVMRLIEAAGPGTPIGWNAETSGGSVLSMQLSLQFLLKEMPDGSLKPNLAESYDVNPDPNNPSVTFHLRKGVKFHDGSDFTAAVVKWNFEQSAAGGMNKGTTQYWKSYDVIDDNTLRVNFTMWQNRLIRSFADGVAYIVSKAAYDTNGLDWIRWHMVGTGPFKQTDFQRDVSLTTAKNENYYETGKPYLDGVKYLYVTDELTRVALFKSGGAEVLNTSGNPKTAKELEAAGYKIISQVGGASVLVPDSLNPNSPWSNLKVRQAAEYAIDREALAKAFGYGYWQAAYQIQSPLSLAFDPNLAGRKFDVAKAKQLLTEAGFTDGFKTKLIVATGGNNDIPTMIQSYLSKVGIQTELELVEPAKYQQYLSGSWENGILLNPLMQWANPNTTFNFFFGVPGSFFQKTLKKPDNWKDILTASLITPAPDAAATKKMEDAAYDDVMVIPLYYGASMWAVTDKVHDSGLGTRGAPTWWEPQNTWLSK